MCSIHAYDYRLKGKVCVCCFFVYFSFSLKELGSGMGAESRLERSKGESRQDNIHLEPGNSYISNNEGEL